MDKTIFIMLGQSMTEKMPIERLTKWNEFINKLSPFTFVFLPGTGAYTTIHRMESFINKSKNDN